MIVLNYFYKFNADNITELIVGGVSGVVLIYIALIGSNSSHKLTNVYKKQAIFDLKLSEIEDTITIITKQDIARAENEVYYYNMVTDIKETLDTEKEIDALGKRIKKESKKIIDEKYNINEYLKKIIIEVCDQLSHIITTEYNYGLEEIHLPDFWVDLQNKVDITINQTDKTKLDKNVFKQVKESITGNIEKYVNNLIGIQGFQNGRRRTLFSDETMNFINLMVKHINEIEIPKKEKA